MADYLCPRRHLTVGPLYPSLERSRNPLNQFGRSLAVRTKTSVCVGVRRVSSLARDGCGGVLDHRPVSVSRSRSRVGKRRVLETGECDTKVVLVSPLFPGFHTLPVRRRSPSFCRGDHTPGTDTGTGSSWGLQVSWSVWVWVSGEWRPVLGHSSGTGSRDRGV